jgi:hypothetical protein
MSLTAHAEAELRAAGMFDKDSDFDGALGPAVLQLVELFAKQGHSGGGAPTVIELFGRLAQSLPIMPLTGKDDEWIDRGEGLLQNRRCSRVFKSAGGEAFDVNGPAGVPAAITFPYNPPKEY